MCAASSKIHTTRKKASAIFCTEDTQLIFFDTPGLVERKDFKKYKLEDSFTNDALISAKDADIIAVIQDITYPIFRESIDKKILDILKECHKDKTLVMILNKIDTLKNKKFLLEVVKNLTEQTWPNFSDVFMISALTGDGICELRVRYTFKFTHSGGGVALISQARKKKFG